MSEAKPTTETEEWRPIAGFEGAYEVSNLGRVRSLTRVTFSGRWHARRIHKGRILKLFSHPDGHLFVGLCDGRGRKVQVWVHPNATELPENDRFFAKAPWSDVQILPPPRHWGSVPDGKVPENTLGFDSATGRPKHWPMRLAKVHWATLLPGLPAGEYTLRCRTIDEKGMAQPLPNPFAKSGHSAIESVDITVKS